MIWFKEQTNYQPCKGKTLQGYVGSRNRCMSFNFRKWNVHEIRACNTTKYKILFITFKLTSQYQFQYKFFGVTKLINQKVQILSPLLYIIILTTTSAYPYLMIFTWIRFIIDQFQNWLEQWFTPQRVIFGT